MCEFVPLTGLFESGAAAFRGWRHRHRFGTAIPNYSVCEDDGEYAPGIAASAGQVHNYRSWDDEVVCDLYSSNILGSGENGLGCRDPDCGWFDSPPSNFTDHSQTFSVDRHCDYPRPDVGCVDEVVGDFGKA